jgi:uncharacterized lipoprotein NlpE involved in copper resistance
VTGRLSIELLPPDSALCSNTTVQPESYKRCLRTRVFLLGLVLTISCRSTRPSLPTGVSESKSQPSRTPNTREAPAHALLGIYVGSLPCADCRGVRTELALYAPGPDQPAGATYRLTETYLGTRDGDRTLESVGRWTVLRGNKAYPNATIYQLSFDQPRDVRNFLRVSDDELRLLDRQQNEIESRVNLSLRRSQASLVGGFVPVDSADDSVRAAADFAVADEARSLNRAIRLESIVRTERQIVAGTNYRLCLKVGTSNGSRWVEALVFQNLKGQLSLTRWTECHC